MKTFEARVDGKLDVLKAVLFSKHDAFIRLMVLPIIQSSILLFLCLFPGALLAGRIDNPSRAQFPEKVKDLNGRVIDISQLTEKKTVTVVTLKATWCPVCQEQLIRLKNNLHLIDTKRVTFIVLSPGPKKNLFEIKEKTGFPYPFIEDKNLRISTSLGLAMSEKEISPSIFILNRNLNIRWMQRGRSGWYYGDEELLNEIGIVHWM